MSGTASQTVDGTGNKTWTINTAVGNNTHEHHYITGGSGWQDVDLNVIADQASAGQLRYEQYASGSTNKPPASDNANGVITVGQHSSNYTAQLAFSSDGKMYHRDNPAGAHGAWQGVFTDAYHPNADKWTTARSHTVTLTGDVTGSATQSVDGTGNKTWTITTAVSNDSHNHNHSDGDFTVNGKLSVDHIKCRTSQDLAITAGESASHLSENTYNDEIIRLAAETGVKVYASTNNLSSGLNVSTTLIDTNGNMSINNGNLTVSGLLTATTKSFTIDHPTKEGKKLRYGSLEGPENGVYVRGKLTGTNVIELPEYWTKLVHEDSITVQLTANGKFQKLYVKDIVGNKVTIGNASWLSNNTNCFYIVYGERKDVDKLEVEFDV